MQRPFLLILLATVMLGGCSTMITPGRTRVETGGVTITTDPGQTQGGKFCPPGQAKKGRC